MKNITKDTNNIQGGLAINKNKKVVIYYTTLLTKYAYRLNTYLNSNGVQSIDLTEQINTSIKSPAYRYVSENVDQMFKAHTDYINTLMTAYSKYEVVFYNVSTFKIVYPFKDYIPYYLSSNYNILTYAEDINLNLYGELMDMDNIYEFEQHELTDEITLHKILIANNSMHGNRVVLVNISLMSELTNTDMFMQFVNKYGLRRIIGFKLIPSAKPILISNDEWETVALNNIKNILS